MLNQLDQIQSSLRQWSQGEALRAIANESQKTAASFLSSVDNVRTRENIASSIANKWSKQDHEEALQWVNSNTDVSNWKESLQTQVLRSLAKEDIQLALDQPITSISTVGLEVAVIEEVASFNVDEAISLLNDSCNQDTRQSAYRATGSALVVKGRSELAMELVAESSREFQYQYFDSFGFLWAVRDPEDMYEKLDSLPTEKITENLALKLVHINSVKKFLTPEKKRLVKFIPPALQGLLEKSVRSTELAFSTSSSRRNLRLADYLVVQHCQMDTSSQSTPND